MKQLRFKSFGVGCNHLIELSNGKVLLIDPYFYYNEKAMFSKECEYGFSQMDDIERVDYILITHTHFDHDMNVKYFVDKFNAKVFVGALSASEFIKFHKIPYDNVFLVNHNQESIFDDFTLFSYQAKHNGTSGRIYDEVQDISLKETGIEGHKQCNHLGSIESLDYLIVTNDNLSILISSGERHNNYILKVCKEKYPNILFRQAGMRKESGDFFTGKQISPEELADVFSLYGAQIAIPFHFDALKFRLSEEEVKDYFDKAKSSFESKNQGRSFIYPKLNKWYGVKLIAVEEE